MYGKAPGHRIRFLRDKCGLTEAELGRLVGLSERKINHIERGTESIANIDRSCLPRMAEVLNTTAVYILEGEIQGELPSEQSTHYELMRMREEGLFHNDEEFHRLTDLAMHSIRQRNDENIPLSRSDLEYLLNVIIRGGDGYQLSF